MLKEVEKAVEEQKATGRRMLIEETDGSSSESDEYEDAQEGNDDTAPMTNGYSEPQQVPSEGNDESQTPSSKSSSQKNISDNRVKLSSDTKVDSGAGDVSSLKQAEKDIKSASPQKADTKNNASLPQKAEDNSLPPAPEPQLLLPPVVLKWKEEGGNLFKSGQYGEAAEMYTKAINKLLPGTVKSLI